MTGVDEPEVASSVRAYYTRRLATGSCCGPGTGSGAATAAGGAELDVPSFGCGAPTDVAELAMGETVLDLGSGAGLDAFRAAAAVGPSGRVIGVDMTPAMVERATAGASLLGLAGVEFHVGAIEALPVADESVDVVISNCVINLAPDKRRVFREVERVLVPGGRMVVSDILVNGAHGRAPSTEGWCACVDGAIDATDFARAAGRAGLVEVVVDPAAPSVAVGETYSAIVTARKADVRRADTAAPSDRLAVAAAGGLLASAGLPLDGWDAPTTRRWVLRRGALVRGAVGLELRGDAALVRSLVVDPELRGRGYGGALLAVALRAAARSGATAAYGLTTTIPDWLTRLGFVETRRDRLPRALADSDELSGSCPDTARVFALDLACDESRGAGAPIAEGAR